MGDLLQQSVDRKGTEIDFHNRAVNEKYHQHSDGKISLWFSQPLTLEVSSSRQKTFQSRRHEDLRPQISDT
jgi:hypothetical protein